MRLPEFTAEASLRKKEESYILTSGPSVDTGRVLPQFMDLPYDPGHPCIWTCTYNSGARNWACACR
jgi:hypothetical protein